MTDHELRVLVVMPGMGAGGGAEQSFAAMVPGLRRAGIRLHLVVLSSRQALVPDLERNGVVIHDLSTTRRLSQRVRSIRGLIRSVEPTVVHATLSEASLPSQLASIGTGAVVLTTWANTSYSADREFDPAVSRWRLAGHQLLEAVVGRVSHSWFHAVTAGVARENAAALRVDQERVMVAERGRDGSRFRAAAPPRPNADAAAPVVLAIGRHEHQKGYASLLRSFEEVASIHPTVELWIAGRTGSATSPVESIRREMRHGARVRFLGHRDDIPELLARSSLVVCSSWREGAAGSLIEAMASSRPIVSVPIAGLDGVLVDEQNALVVPRDQLAEGIVRVLEDPELAKRLGESGRSTFDQRFTIDRCTQAMIDIYLRLARAQPTASGPARGRD